LDYVTLLARPEIIQERAAAEQDLPSDTWTSASTRFNESRWRREVAVASALLREIRPEVKRMTTSALWESLVTTSSMNRLERGGVADCLYEGGNHLVITALQKKPPRELEALRPLTEDSSDVFTSTLGGPMPRSQLLEMLLQKSTR
jgi:hypothetical protein